MDFSLEKRGSRTQNSTEGPKFGPRANGILSKSISKSQDNESPKYMRRRAKKACGNIVTDKKFKGQSLGRATCCSLTESKLGT